MESSESPFLVCTPTAFGRPLILSEQRSCSRCRCAVWVAPSGVEHLAQHPSTDIVCVRCFLVFASTTDEQLDFTAPPGALDEIRAALHPKENN